MKKNELRKIIREAKKLHAAELPAESLSICQKVINDGLWRWAGTVLLYHALTDEVNTETLIEHAVRMGKKVLLPVVVGDDLELRIYEGKDSMSIGPFGILEPTGEVFPEERYGEITLAIIPGMAFDSYCNRLGRGKGYYDRLLPRLKNAHKIGICFPFQKVDKVETDAHDVRMNEVLY